MSFCSAVKLEESQTTNENWILAECAGFNNLGNNKYEVNEVFYRTKLFPIYYDHSKWLRFFFHFFLMLEKSGTRNKLQIYRVIYDIKVLSTRIRSVVRLAISIRYQIGTLIFFFNRNIELSNNLFLKYVLSSTIRHIFEQVCILNTRSIPN